MNTWYNEYFVFLFQVFFGSHTQIGQVKSSQAVLTEHQQLQNQKFNIVTYVKYWGPITQHYLFPVPPTAPK